jgi:hypothetical protein
MLVTVAGQIISAELPHRNDAGTHSLGKDLTIIPVAALPTANIARISAKANDIRNFNASMRLAGQF